MRERWVTALSMLALAIVGATLTTTARAQPPWTPPKTEWGDPDLQGIWNYATLTPLERPANLGDQAIFTEEEAVAFERQYLQRQEANTTVTAGFDWWDSGTAHLANRRTSLIVDPPNGRMPMLTTQAQANSRRGRGGARTDGPEDLGLNVRCLQYPTAGPPLMPGMYNVDVQLVQTRQYVVILSEMIHDARIVPMDGRPHGTLKNWMGDSRGHWEGATLVVDSVNLRVPFRGSDESLHLIERFTRTADNTIEYRFTVDDPTVWTQPWTASYPMRRTDLKMFEYACHEGNERSMIGTLKTARAEDGQPQK